MNRQRTALRRRDFYFKGITEAEAARRADALRREWEFLVKNWQRLYAGPLRIVGSPWADIPHWQPSLGDQPTEQQIDDFQDRQTAAADTAEAYADVALSGVLTLYDLDQQTRVAHAEIQQSTYHAVMKSLRKAIGCFPDGLLMPSLSHSEIQAAKTKLLAQVGRRTARNHLMNVRRMLLWFYGSDYGRGHGRPSHFDSVFKVSNAKRSDITTYTAETIAEFLNNATARERLYIMLALNTGMYQADIGRLTLEEMEVGGHAVFWDREKQPQNPFRVRHELWPETRVLVLQFVQAKGRRAQFDPDWRDGREQQIRCATLAFVDDAGRALYRITKNGRAYDKIGKAVARLNARLSKRDKTTLTFKSLRKSTNQLLCELLENTAGDDQQGLVAVGEISKQFLGQRTDLLARLYKTTGPRLYTRMNRYLLEAGGKLRAAGAFDCLLERPDPGGGGRRRATPLRPHVARET